MSIIIVLPTSSIRVTQLKMRLSECKEMLVTFDKDTPEFNKYTCEVAILESLLGDEYVHIDKVREWLVNEGKDISHLDNITEEICDYCENGMGLSSLN